MNARQAVLHKLPPASPGVTSPAAEADWIAALRVQCKRTSQGKVARVLGISSAVVNQLLRGRYDHDTGRLEVRVRGEFMRAVVTCPVLGEISTRRCQDEQARPFSAMSPITADLYQACRGGCPNFTGKS